MPDQSLIDYFFPYQKRYLLDKSKVKILEKSRRIGGTYVQSFEDVQDCIEQPGLKIFFSSADMTAAAEYMDYIAGWVAKLNTIAKALAEINCEDISECEFADEDKGVKSKVIEFNNGSKIYALSSNPKAFRSKGGKIVWDEAAHHKDDRKMWAAAKPAAMWGYSIRILSTHNGVNSLFYLIIDKCKKGELDYSVHTVPIQLAVEEGLADRICGRKLSRKEREAWLENEHKGCLTEAIWQEEYCCN
ncbi:terminase family protein, partial [uncultured Fibrobacter sp.]|uniref:terminase large subunit domain-containing protein n=1 Tax=uncultured Fibrobacter sp. TaxID=261512 RepID=UPI0025D3B1D8